MRQNCFAFDLDPDPAERNNDLLCQQLAETRRANAHLREERRALQRRIIQLEAETSALTTLLRRGTQLSAPASQSSTDALVRALTRLAAQVHPDRHGGAAVAEEVTKAVLKLRDELRGRWEAMSMAEFLTEKPRRRFILENKTRLPGLHVGDLVDVCFQQGARVITCRARVTYLRKRYRLPSYRIIFEETAP